MEPTTDTGRMVKKRGVHMYREASDSSEHSLVSGILISPAELHRIEREAKLQLLDELEVGFANNPKHHTSVIYKVRETIAV